MRASSVDRIELTDTLAVAEDIRSRAKVAFYAERDSTQKEIEQAARLARVEPVEYYLAATLNAAINARFDYAMSKREKVLSGALMILIAQGMTEDEARMRLGLGEK